MHIPATARPAEWSKTRPQRLRDWRAVVRDGIDLSAAGGAWAKQ